RHHRVRRAADPDQPPDATLGTGRAAAVPDGPAGVLRVDNVPAHFTLARLAALLELDAHDHPPDGGAADLHEPGVLEDLTGPHVQFAPDDLLAGLGDHRVGLERPGAALSGEVDRGPGEGIGEAAA